jgi:iron(III) transport system ATP-binding protein
MIRVEDLHVHYVAQGEDVHAVRGVNIDVAPGEFYTLLGPSGCGKTTTLRCIAGLEQPTSGRILIDGKPIYSSRDGLSVAAHRRNIGMVFQSYAIWPHMTVFENVAFPLREMRPRPDEATIKRRVGDALELVQLTGYAERPAPLLSGGQQQRLALARAIVREAPVVLLDEPLSNLDAKLRAETRRELRMLVKRLSMTAIYVTHDQTEALTMSDRVAVMEAGQIIQESSPRDIYQRPMTRFVASFIGQTNFAEGTIDSIDADGSGVIITPWTRLHFTGGSGRTAGEKVTAAVRPENLMPHRPGDTADNVITGTVVDLVFLGDYIEGRVKVADTDIGIRLHPSHDLAVGTEISLRISPSDVRLLTR